MNDILSIRALLEPDEKIMLYALVRGLRPTNILEIGSAFGGSARIIHQAMLANGCGNLHCVDINPQPELEVFADALPDVTLIKGSSWDLYTSRRDAETNALFDFVFIDGDHSYRGVKQDIECAISMSELGAVLLFHDAHNPEVKRAIGDSLHYFGVDCGILTVHAPVDKNTNTTWGGLRMLRLK